MLVASVSVQEVNKSGVSVSSGGKIVSKEFDIELTGFDAADAPAIPLIEVRE